MSSCNCSIVKNSVEPLSSKAVAMLYDGLAPYKKYGPETFERCLGTTSHTQECVKSWTNEQKAELQRTVQTLFLQTFFAEEWGKSYMPNLIEGLPKQSHEAFEFLMNLSKKGRDSDKALIRKVAKTEDADFISKIFNIIIGIKEPQLVVEAYRKFPKKDLIDKVVRTLLLYRVNDVSEPSRDFPVVRALIAYIGKHVPEVCKKGWAAFTNSSLQEENARIVEQLKDEACFFSAYSITEKSVKEYEGECPLYKQLEALASAEDPQAAWKSIPEELKKEHAYSFACLLMQKKFEAKDKTALKAVCKNFVDTTCQSLDEEVRDSIVMMLGAEKFLRNVLQG